MHGKRVTEEEKKTIFALKAKGWSGAAIARRLNRPQQTVHFVLKPRKKKGYGNQRRSGYTHACIIETPNDLFTVGAYFRMIDVAFSVKYSELPNGLCFEIRYDGKDPLRATMQGGRLIREDGVELIWTGGRWLWREVMRDMDIHS